MAADNVTAYLSEAERLRNIYRGRMKIYAAMEIDYLGPDWGRHTHSLHLCPWITASDPCTLFRLRMATGLT